MLYIYTYIVLYIIYIYIYVYLIMYIYIYVYKYTNRYIFIYMSNTDQPCHHVWEILHQHDWHRAELIFYGILIQSWFVNNYLLMSYRCCPQHGTRRPTPTGYTEVNFTVYGCMDVWIYIYIYIYLYNIIYIYMCVCYGVLLSEDTPNWVLPC